MTIRVDVPGGPDLRLEHLVLDVNGTLTDRGDLVEGAGERLARLRRDLALHVLSADTFGTAEAVGQTIGGDFRRIGSGLDKLAYVERLGAGCCVAIGNGANDAAMLRAAALGLAVAGPEGAHRDALAACDVAVGSILAALDLLLAPRALVATLRP
jgi:P-type E1-E2 ATPase